MHWDKHCSVCWDATEGIKKYWTGELTRLVEGSPGINLGITRETLYQDFRPKSEPVSLLRKRVQHARMKKVRQGLSSSIGSYAAIPTHAGTFYYSHVPLTQNGYLVDSGDVVAGLGPLLDIYIRTERILHSRDLKLSREKVNRYVLRQTGYARLEMVLALAGEKGIEFELVRNCWVSVRELTGEEREWIEGRVRNEVDW